MLKLRLVLGKQWVLQIIFFPYMDYYLNNNKKLFCAFIDFSKAFDYVVRDNLWYKLIKLGIRGKLVNIITSMYQNVMSRVKFNNEKSKDIVCHTGVRRGECLSLFLFSMFINDLEEEKCGGFRFWLFWIIFMNVCWWYCSIFRNSRWFTKWVKLYISVLTVNIQKTKVMVFRKGGIHRRNTHFYNGEHEIEIVNKFAYLGIVFSTGAFSEAQQAHSGQALKANFSSPEPLGLLVSW